MWLGKQTDLKAGLILIKIDPGTNRCAGLGVGDTGFGISILHETRAVFAMFWVFRAAPSTPQKSKAVQKSSHGFQEKAMHAIF